MTTTYRYVATDGTELRKFRDDAKRFWWEPKLDGLRPHLYHHDELEAAETWQPIFLCEGEKAADAVRSLGLLATSLHAGAGSKLEEHHLAALRGRVVFILNDNDKPGITAAWDWYGALIGVASYVSILPLFPASETSGDDAVEWIERGGTGGKLLDIALYDFKTALHEASRPKGWERPWETAARIGLDAKTYRYATGIPAIDAATRGGLPGGSTIILVGPPGSGKTMLAAQLLKRFADKFEFLAVGFFCDEGRDAANVRIGQMCGLDRDAVERGDPAAAVALEEYYRDVDLWLPDPFEEKTIEDLFDNVDRMAQRGAPRIVAIDSAQRVKSETATGEARRHDVKALAVAAQHYARRTGAIVILCSQANRASWKSKKDSDNSSKLSAAAEGSIEYEADLQIFLSVVGADDTTRMTCSKSRLGAFDPEKDILLKLDRKRAVFEEPNEAEAKAIQEAEDFRAIHKAAERIEEIVTERPGEFNTGQLEQQVGGRKQTFNAAMQWLKENKRLVANPGKGTAVFWSPGRLSF